MTKHWALLTIYAAVLKLVVAHGQTDDSIVPGQVIRLRSENYADHYLRHRRGEIWIDPWDFDRSALFDLDSKWVVVPGLSGRGVSFQAKNYPNTFLRHRDGLLYNDLYENSDLFRNDASWIVEQALSGYGISLRSTNYPSDYIRHQDGRCKLHLLNPDSDLDRNDASWRVAVLEDADLRASWKLVFSARDAAVTQTFRATVSLGSSISRSRTVQHAWQVSLNAEASILKWFTAVSASTAYSGFVATTSTSEYNRKHEYSYEVTVPAGKSVYVWQWVMEIGSPDFRIENTFYNFRHTLNNSPPQGPP